MRLGDVADVRVRPTPTVIQRESSSRRIDVTADVSGRGLGAVQDDVSDRIRALELPARVPRAGDRRRRRRRGHRDPAVGFGLAAAIGIFLLLQAAFGSWRLASLAFLTLPVALVGGELAGLIDGGAFSLGSLAGLLAVLGIAARNGVVLIGHFQRLEEREGERSGRSSSCAAQRERLAPIVAVAVAPRRRCSRSCCSATAPAPSSCGRWRWWCWAAWSPPRCWACS